ncbi:MAG: Phosphodiesterase YfcE [Desulfovibrio sp.]
MKLLIASDIHGSLAATRRIAALMERENPESLVLLGDILYHGPRNPFPGEYNPAEVVETLNAFKDKIIAVRGNCDSEVDQMVLAFTLAEPTSWIFTEDGRILAAHGHRHSLGAIRESARLAGGDAFLSGHTHVPTARLHEGVHMWNPGSASLPKEGFPPSYAVFEDGRFTVFSLDGERLMQDSFI